MQSWITRLAQTLTHRRTRDRRSAGWLLRRADDHLLRDIGLTRAELCDLLDGRQETDPRVNAPSGKNTDVIPTFYRRDTDSTN